MINQGVARAFARVRRPGVLTFAAVSEVGVSGRRVDGGHSLNSQHQTGFAYCVLRIAYYGSRLEQHSCVVAYCVLRMGVPTRLLD